MAFGTELKEFISTGSSVYKTGMEGKLRQAQIDQLGAETDKIKDGLDTEKGAGAAWRGDTGWGNGKAEQPKGFFGRLFNDPDKGNDFAGGGISSPDAQPGYGQGSAQGGFDQGFSMGGEVKDALAAGTGIYKTGMEGKLRQAQIDHLGVETDKLKDDLDTQQGAGAAWRDAGGKGLPVSGADGGMPPLEAQADASTPAAAPSGGGSRFNFGAPGTGPSPTYAGNMIGAESGGDVSAANPRSSARGPAQFVDGTWLNMAKTKMPDVVAGKNDQQILAMRTDPLVGPQMARDMTNLYAKDNAPVLKQAGVPVTDATLAMAHFLGPQGATRALTADPRTPMASLVTPKALEANPQLSRQTAGSLLSFYQNKMAPVRSQTASVRGYAEGGEVAAAPAPEPDPITVPIHDEPAVRLAPTGGDTSSQIRAGLPMDGDAPAQNRTYSEEAGPPRPVAPRSNRGLPTGAPGPAPGGQGPAGVSADDLNGQSLDDAKAGRDPVRGALEFMRGHFGLNDGQASSPGIPTSAGVPQGQNGGVEGLLRGSGAADNQTVSQVLTKVDPQQTMTQGQRLNRGLDAVTEFYYSRGKFEQGDKAAASMLQNYRQNMMRFGGQAIAAASAGDWGSAAKLMQASYDFVPDGFTSKVQATATGLQVNRIGPDGKQVGVMQITDFNKLRDVVGYSMDFDNWAKFLLSERKDAETVRSHGADEKLRGQAQDETARSHLADEGLRGQQIAETARHNPIEEGQGAKRIELSQQQVDQAGQSQQFTQDKEREDRDQGARATAAHVEYQRQTDRLAQMHDDPSTTDDQLRAQQAAVNDANDAAHASLSGVQPRTLQNLEGIRAKADASKQKADAAGTMRQYRMGQIDLMKAQTELATARATASASKLPNDQKKLDLAQQKVDEMVRRNQALEGRVQGPKATQPARTPADRTEVHGEMVNLPQAKEMAPADMVMAEQVAQSLAQNNGMSAAQAAGFGAAAVKGTVKVDPVEPAVVMNGQSYTIDSGLHRTLLQRQQEVANGATGDGKAAKPGMIRGLIDAVTGSGKPSAPKPMGLPVEPQSMPAAGAPGVGASMTPQQYDQAYKTEQVRQYKANPNAGMVAAGEAAVAKLGARPKVMLKPSDGLGLRLEGKVD